MTIAEAKRLDPNIKEIYRLDKEGYAYGQYIAGDLFIGSIYDLVHGWWLKDTPENREFAERHWSSNSFAKEVRV